MEALNGNIATDRPVLKISERRAPLLGVDNSVRRESVRLGGGMAPQPVSGRTAEEKVRLRGSSKTQLGELVSRPQAKRAQRNDGTISLRVITNPSAIQP
jgi:hypothetical protein